MAEPIEPPVTLSEQASADMEAYNSGKVTLADYSAKGTAEFAQKRYESAVEHYAEAASLQVEINGEMAPENAEILFLYGRALFKVGQQKSDVLGGPSSEGRKTKKKSNGTKKEAKGGNSEAESKIEEEVAGEKLAEAITSNTNGGAKAEEGVDAKKPLFQFTGDENFEDSDDDDDAEGEDDDEEEEDDLALAFEVLDLARVLFTQRLKEPEEGEDKGKSVGDSSMTKHIKERLGETHDLLAEISLENEKFAGAVTDFRAALIHKQELYPEESEIIAEAHFKLSLALEFASIKRPEGEEGEEPKSTDKPAPVDQALRNEAVKELEAAINSTKLKLQNKEVELASSSNSDDNEVTRAQIVDVKEMVADMENRLNELKGPPINFKEALNEQLNQQSELITGILAAATGETREAAAARLEEAKKGATDLTGLVRHKKKPFTTEVNESNSANGNGKRKAEEDLEEVSNEGVKKAKVD